MIRLILPLTIFSIITLGLKAQTPTSQKQPSRNDTLKGSNTPDKSWWDIIHYDLIVKPDYTNKTISGKNSIQYKILTTGNRRLQIDLQAPLRIDSVLFHQKRLSFSQEGDAWFINLPAQKTSRTQSIGIYYSGKPKQSVNPPWDGGIIWTTDSVGRPWMAVASQLSGASIWYPCKANMDDEPELGASITIIVPDTLTAVANGHLTKQNKEPKGNNSYTWEVKNPINNYGLTFYIGKYVHVADKYPGEKGPLEMDFWVLDYNKEKVPGYLIPEVHKTFPSFEHWFGPYPFYEDGFKMVEAPYIGMEHQGAIGYGNHFERGRYKGRRLTYWDYKTDRMVVHENAHEWFGNNITAKDPADRWIQEAFAGYAEELVMEDWYGQQAGEELFLARSTGRIGNEKPIISRCGIFEDGGDDMYMKGWVLVHMIRAIIGNDEKFRQLLREMNSTFYHQTVSSRQIEDFISLHSGIDLSKVFDQYLRTVQIPALEYKITKEHLSYRFSNCIPGFSMTIPINGTKGLHITPDSNWQEIPLPADLPDTIKIDRNYYLESKKVE